MQANVKLNWIVKVFFNYLDFDRDKKIHLNEIFQESVDKV